MAFVQRSTSMASSRIAAMARTQVLSSARPTMMRAMLAKQLPVRQFSRLNFKPTSRMLEQVKEEHRAHTVSQRLRQIRKIPVELWPLAVVLAIAVVAAAYSLIHKLLSDTTLRLYRQNRKD